MESEFDASASELIEDVLAYLNRDVSSLDLKLALRESFLNAEFVTDMATHVSNLFYFDSFPFGSFGDAFFARYRELRPLADGFFELRRDIYNLYPLLVHTTLFGGHYAQAVLRILARHG